MAAAAAVPRSTTARRSDHGAAAADGRRARAQRPRPCVAAPSSVVAGRSRRRADAQPLGGGGLLADSAHLAHGPGRLAAEQDALGPDGPGRDHRRGGRDRHDRDRPGLEDRRSRRRSPAWAPTTCSSCRARPPAAASASASAACMTLTPEDGDEIARQCPAVSDVAPIVRATAQVVYGNRNWMPSSVLGTTPAYLAVRDWEDMLGGRHLHRSRRAATGNKVCLVGDHHQARTVRRRIARRQGNPHPQRRLPGHRRAQPPRAPT